MGIGSELVVGGGLVMGAELVVGTSSEGTSSELVVGGGLVMGAELIVGTSSEGTGSESVVGGGSVMGAELVVGTGSVMGKGVAKMSLGTTDIDGDCITPLRWLADVVGVIVVVTCIDASLEDDGAMLGVSICMGMTVKFVRTS